MGEFIASALPAWGLDFGEKLVRVRNRTGGNRLRGEVLMFDMALTVATNYKIGDQDSAFVNCIQPTAAEDGHGFFCLLVEDIASGADGLAALWSPSRLARFDAGNDPANVGLAAGCNGGTFTLDATAFNAAAKVLAYAQETTAQKPAGSLFAVMWNGIYGLGKG